MYIYKNLTTEYNSSNLLTVILHYLTGFLHNGRIIVIAEITIKILIC